MKRYASIFAAAMATVMELALAPSQGQVHVCVSAVAGSVSRDAEQAQARDQDTVITPRGALENAQKGKNLSEEEAAMLVQSPDFSREVEDNPGLAEAISRHPYAASQFYRQANYREWHERHPEEGKLVEEAAAKWDKMSQKDKEDFFQNHPTLKGEHPAEGKLRDIEK